MAIKMTVFKMALWNDEASLIVRDQALGATLGRFADLLIACARVR